MKYKHCKCFLEYINFKDNLIEYKFLSCKKKYQKKNIKIFSNHDNYKFI